MGLCLSRSEQQNNEGIETSGYSASKRTSRFETKPIDRSKYGPSRRRQINDIF